MSKQKRMCFFVPVDGYVEGHGFRVSVVTEGESGHCPTGKWPNDGTMTMPYFWGNEYQEACKIAEKQNRRLGHSARDVAEILASSMFGILRKSQAEIDRGMAMDILNRAEKVGEE